MGLTDQIMLQLMTTKTLPRLLVFLALFSLGVLGGTYSHAAENGHTHSATNDQGHTVSVHSHASDKDARFDQSNSLHCGSNIIATLSANNQIMFHRAIAVLIGGPTESLETLLNVDPPPPRTSS